MKWGQLANPSSHWTIGFSKQWYVVALLCLTLFHFILAWHLPPAEDELYYWAWSRTWEWSYFDHPPLVAYFIRFSTALFGDNLLGIRFFACVIGTLVLLQIGLLTRTRQILGLLLFTPIFFWGSVLMTPDIPLVLFWSLYFYWLIGINRSFSEWNDDPVTRVYHKSPVAAWQWGLGGILLGLGFLSKYTMFLAVPCAFLVLATKYRFRAWQRGFAIHLALAGLIAVPVFLFNLENGFAPFRFQWNHAAMAQTGFSFSHFFEFVGTQLLLLGALPFLMLPWVISKRKWICNDPVLHVCFYFFLFPFVFFLFQAFRTRLEANWALVAYLSFWPMAQKILDQSSFRYAARFVLSVTFLFPLLCSFLLLIHLISPIGMLPPEKDRVGKLLSQYQLSKIVANDVAKYDEGKTIPLYLPTYQWTAYFRFQNLLTEQIGAGGRLSQFNLHPTDACSHRKLLVFASKTGELPPSLNCFPHVRPLVDYPLVVRGKELVSYRLTELTR